MKEEPKDNLFYFYNPCQTCGNTDIVIHDDVEHKISKAGGLRVMCYKCGRNTATGVWNKYNPKDGRAETEEFQLPPCG